MGQSGAGPSSCGTGVMSAHTLEAASNGSAPAAAMARVVVGCGKRETQNKGSGHAFLARAVHSVSFAWRGKPSQRGGKGCGAHIPSASTSWGPRLWTVLASMPRLETLPPSYVSTFASLFSAHPPQPRREIARALLLRSVRLRVTRERAAGEDEERLEGFQRGTLPLRIRPVFVVLNIFCILGLGLLGFHPNGQAYVPINDKILHFICFLFVSRAGGD